MRTKEEIKIQIYKLEKDISDLPDKAGVMFEKDYEYARIGWPAEVAALKWVLETSKMSEGME